VSQNNWIGLRRAVTPAKAGIQKISERLDSCFRKDAIQTMIADKAIQIHGGMGYMIDYPVERFYREVRLTRIYEGASEIQLLVIAPEILKD
jgi:hypothetical protein